MFARLFKKRSSHTMQEVTPAAAISAAAGSGSVAVVRTRRGTVIILALGVLAVLAIAAVSYVSIVRIDREASAANSKDVNYQQQVSAVVGQVQSLLAADLFGKKIVTPTVPQRYWPRMFEDGGTTDFPRTEGPWIVNNAIPGNFTTNANKLAADRSAPTAQRVGNPDDAWLASTEPVMVDANNNYIANPYWQQITNLRSGYVFKSKDTSGGVDRWERQDGRYVDLMQWFLNPDAADTPLHADPSLNLLDPALALGPIAGVADYLNGSDSNVVGGPTNVYGLQMPKVDNFPPNPGNTTLRNHNERRWVDTDGDGRPDARWTQLESMGNLFGLNWVVAARVIDASSLVNFNTAIEFPLASHYGSYINSAGTTPSGKPRVISDCVGTGLTPADVDLKRLLSYAIVDPSEFKADGPVSGVFSIPVVGGRVNGADGRSPSFRDFLDSAIGYRAGIGDLAVGDPAPYDPRVNFGDNVAETNPAKLHPEQEPINVTGGYTPSDLTTRVQRQVIYEAFGSDPDGKLTDAFIGLPDRDLIDLQAFWGTNNNSVTSKFEQWVDGNEADGYLPGTTSRLDIFGPLRAREGVPGSGTNASLSPRSFTTGQPTLARINNDIRHLLTPISGVGDASPVPVLSPAPGGTVQQTHYFDGRYANTRISIPALRAATDSGAVSNEDVQRVFDSLVWALAPLATDQPLNRRLAENNLYGTATIASDPDAHYGGGPSGPTSVLAGINTPIGCGYAVLRAASYATNLFDAIDGVSTVDASTADEPTLVRLFNQNAAKLPDALTNTALNGVKVIGTRLSQGSIPDTSLPPNFVGLPANGVTIAGIDRQPFLREASYMAFYEATTPGSTVTLTPTDTDQQIGSILAIELGNPWSQPVRLNQYRIGIGDGSQHFELDLTGLPASDQILPGKTTIVWYPVPPTNTAFDPQFNDPATGIKARFAGHAFGTASITPTMIELPVAAGAPAPTQPVFLQTLAAGGSSMPVVLIHHRASGATTHDIIVDRLSPKSGETNAFPAVRPAPYVYTFPSLGAGPPTPCNDGLIRFAVSSSLKRPTGDALTGGFPQYVIERRDQNTAELGPVAAEGDPGPGAGIVYQLRQTWRTGPAGCAAPETAPDASLLLDAAITDGNTLGADKGTFTDFATVIPFQLFVPNAPLATTGSLLSVPDIATLYIHDSTLVEDYLRGYDLAKSYQGDDLKFQPGGWFTFSEQLGSKAELFRNSGSGAVNPYLGVLDPSRFIISRDSGTYNNLPESMKIPLALRVPDCFEALSLREPLAQGRININTAPKRVLELLPFVSPLAQVVSQFRNALSLDAPTPGTDYRTVRYMLDYRDPYRTGAVVPRESAANTNMVGLRTPAGDPVRGFETAAELAVLGRWQNADLGTIQPGGTDGGFLRVANDGQVNDGLPFGRPKTDYATGQSAALDSGAFKPKDDPEERAALYSAVSNIVSTRSEVYLAWFVIRGYDPELIESIPVAAANDVTAAQNAMDNADFRPTYESRWLVVLDRSNVKKPTDRPKVLLQVELPSARP